MSRFRPDAQRFRPVRSRFASARRFEQQSRTEQQKKTFGRDAAPSREEKRERKYRAAEVPVSPAMRRAVVPLAGYVAKNSGGAAAGRIFRGADREATAKPLDTTSLAKLAHYSALLGLLIPWANLAAPALVLYYGRERRSRLLNTSAKESINFQGTIEICRLVLGFVFPRFYRSVSGLITLYGAAAPVIAAIQTGGSKSFRYPLTIRFLREREP